MASALIALVFGGLITGVRLMISLIGESKAETGARSLALSRLEYIRSLDYGTIGTVDGIPAGFIPQVSTSTLNGIEYTERILILYIDRPEDGLEDQDENGVLEDSKRVKVEYSWMSRGQEKSLALITDVAPKGMETSSGGGTLIVKVFDAEVSPVSNAVVHITNTSVATNTINLTLETNNNGLVVIPGAPVRGGYHISVTKNGYSTASTYPATANNPNPNPPAVAVASTSISTVPFFIDELSKVTIRTVGEPIIHDVIDDFSSSSGLVNPVNVEAVSGELHLTFNSETGQYQGNGEVYSTPVSSSATAWNSFSWDATNPNGTSALVRLYSELNGVHTIVPDSALPGNSAGFSAGPIDISGLPITDYPRLSLKVNLVSTDSSITPSLDNLTISYVESEPVINNVPFNIAGTKTIGTEVLKYKDSGNTGTAGEFSKTLEWDSYTVSLNSSGYVIKEIKGGASLLNLLPGADVTLSFVLIPPPPRSLYVTVTDSAGNLVPGAAVRVYGVGYDETISTSSFGQTFFAGMPVSGDYNMTVEGSGFEDYATAVSITGNLATQVILVATE